MSNLIDDTRAWWLGQAAIAALVGERCHYLHVPQSYKGSYLWYARVGSGDDEFRCLDDAPGEAYQFVELIDVEAISENERQAEELALELKKLDSFLSLRDGPYGAGTVQAVFVRDHTDDYVPMGTGGDDGRAVGALRLEVRGYKPGG